MTQLRQDSSLVQAAKVQFRVWGALTLRELQTRFGRENIGFLWMIVEPAMLAAGVTVMHLVQHTTLPEDIDPLPFYGLGYISFMMFRSVVNRASNTVRSNRPLLYHRQVQMFDLLMSSAILEFCATFLTFMVFVIAFNRLGLSPFPKQPLLLIGGMLLMAWYSLSLATIVCAAAEISHAVDRFVHAATYLALPVSGMFFRIAWLPDSSQRLLQWLPLPQITDLVRQGVWRDLQPSYVNIPYIVAICGVQSLVGLAALRVARPHIRFA